MASNNGIALPWQPFILPSAVWAVDFFGIQSSGRRQIGGGILLIGSVPITPEWPRTKSANRSAPRF
ncbi:hypothetical protein V6667_04245 [Neisseria leonii]|uniref:Uncharacterized protein n=1 Tax=Neisseria leonii TaxID=2995413 RepID=A0A9X4IA16_9NEIS|nr:hypothetical protein [Neisseria sp. 51.81]MDD9326935.1 hypothetical protein [Neisseria sp. 51.81]